MSLLADRTSGQSESPVCLQILSTAIIQLTIDALSNKLNLHASCDGLSNRPPCRPPCQSDVPLEKVSDILGGIPS